MSNAEIVRAVFAAFETDDRDRLKALLAPGFRFYSPYDNGIDRDTYIEVCWPAHAMIQRFDLIRVLEQGSNVVVTYDGTFLDGHRNRNTEIFTLAHGLVEGIEVYFGWNLPHPVAGGTHEGP